MKRTPLQRHTPLVRSAMPPRTTPLRRSTARLGVRRPVRTSEEQDARDKVKARSGGLCELQIPGVCTGSATDWCHRVREGQGGPWSPANGLHGCRACHSWTHRNPAAARVKGWALKSYDPLADPVCRRGEWVRLTDDGGLTTWSTTSEGAAG